MMPGMSASLDPLTSLLVDYIEIPSVTGNEEDYGNALARSLEQRGLAVERQEVEPGRFNLLARAGQPEVVFCTHLDTVPPFFGSRVDADFVHGRGSCDAKGQAVSMLSAVENLLKAGEDRVGLLFTVGEFHRSGGAHGQQVRQGAQGCLPRATHRSRGGGPFESGHWTKRRA
jgi:acetylornithine deacetylase